MRAFRKPIFFILGLVLFTVIVLAVSNLRQQKTKQFELKKLEQVSALGTAAPISEILPEGVSLVCVLGPYSSVEFSLDGVAEGISNQIDKSPVDEGHVRIVVFDQFSKIISESDIPRGHGRVRIDAEGINGAFCQSPEAVLVEVVKIGNKLTIKIFR